MYQNNWKREALEIFTVFKQYRFLKWVKWDNKGAKVLLQNIEQNRKYALMLV